MQAVNKMFFANSRSRFKSKPPKIYIYCLELVCLIVLLTLLTVQLRAVELPPAATQNVPRQSPAEIFIHTNQSNRTDSIDRDDQSHTYEDNDRIPTPTVPLSTQPETTEQITNESATQSDDGAALIEATTLSAPPRILNSSAGFEESEDLFVSPATAQTVQAAPQDESPSLAAYVQNQHLQELQLQPQPTSMPSLAEMTAAGTAAGMLIHDLMAQANMNYNQPAFGSASEQVDSENGEQISPTNSESGDAELAAQMQQLASNDQQQLPLMQDQAGLEQAGDEDEESGEEVGRAPMLTRAEAVHRLNAAQQQTSLEPGEAAEPASEDASPDSIESLMGPEGADLSNNDDAQEQSELDGGQQAQSQQQADSNLINEPLASQLASQAPYPMARSSNEDDEENDDGSEPGSAIAAEGSQLRANHVGGSVPVLMSTRYGQPGEQFNALRAGPQLEHNLVAPMRESLVDLNAAAGHYHKKKKKVKKVKKKKKIIIKKKKKKKKKMMKYKKIKIVKIKKKKKKVKKMPKKHHHHHHHDHGKYYMYAKVPKKKAWEFGFKKGNKKHWIERHEKGYKNKFKTKVKWYDKKSKGKGVHIWDYNHYDKKKKKHH